MANGTKVIVSRQALRLGSDFSIGVSTSYCAEPFEDCLSLGA